MKKSNRLTYVRFGIVVMFFSAVLVFIITNNPGRILESEGQDIVKTFHSQRNGNIPLFEENTFHKNIIDQGGFACDFQLNEYTSSQQAHVAIDVTSDGNIITVWDSRRQQSGTYGVYARMFDSSGQPLSDEIQVNNYSKSMQQDPVVSTDSYGGFWIVWTSYGQDGDGWGIVARYFSADPDNVTPEIGVNNQRTGNQIFPSVAVNKRGEALVVWLDQNQASAHIVARLFDRSGQPKGSEFIIDRVSSDSCHRTPSIVWIESDTDSANGHFLLVWAQPLLQQNTSVIYAQRLDSQGLPISCPSRLSEASGINIEPTIATNSSGSTVVGWFSSSDDSYIPNICWFDSKTQNEFSTLLPGIEGSHMSGLSVAISDNNQTIVCGNIINEKNNEADIIAYLFNKEHDCEVGPVTVTRHHQGQQQLTIARGSKRVLWKNNNQIIFGWHGDAGQADKSAANISLISFHDDSCFPIPGQKPKPQSVKTYNPGLREAKPHEPPVFDPDWKPLPRIKGLKGDGPDFGFEGVPGTGWKPPDPELAVGPDHIVLIVNGEIAFFSKSGLNLFRDEIEDSYGFWGSLGTDNFVFDPEVLYDPHTQRFWAMACERSDDNKSNFLLAVSDDSNPVGTWYKWRLDVTSLAGNDIDSPNMAVDNKAVYLTADFFGPDKYLIYMLNKTPLLSGGAPSETHLLITGQQSIGLPITYDGFAPAQYMIESTENSTNSIVRFHALRNVLTTPTRETYDLTVEPYRYPGQPPQKGTTYRPYLFEPRFWSCMYLNGSLWATHHIRRVGETETITRWYEFNMNGWPLSGQYPTIAQWGEIEDGSGIHCYFPSICADDQGNAAITFARSSTEEYISMRRVGRKYDDPAGVFQDQVLVKEGLAPYYYDRWGDYSGTKCDPIELGTFWGHHEWADSNGDWRTWVGQFIINAPQVPTMSGLGLLGLTVGLSIFLAKRRKEV